MRLWHGILTICLAPFAYAAVIPEGAHVDLYFPHLADGGTAAFKFQTSITLLNPSPTGTASVGVALFGDNGAPLALDFGQGPVSTISLNLPPGGTRTFRSVAASPTAVGGWALAASNLPLQGTVQFRSIVNGIPQQEISAPCTLPSQSYVSPATALTGVALANPFGTPLAATVAALDGGGNQIASAVVSVATFGHTAFNLNGLLPSLPASFSGSVRITPVVSGYSFLAWTLSVDASGVLSSYPPGRQSWPISHLDAIRDAYYQDLNAAQYLSGALGLGIPFSDQTVPLNVLYDQFINAFARKSDNSVNIELALSELISDSPSELAFAVAHEMGHIIQFKTGKAFFYTNIESDADQWGMFISLIAGYDPYAAAGTLAKLAMASNDASLLAQTFDSISGDLHGSFNNRIQLVYSSLESVCQEPTAKTFCANYKRVVHPQFPPSTPLIRIPR